MQRHRIIESTHTVKNLENWEHTTIPTFDVVNLLPLINTIDEIPIERYGVNVNDVVTHGVSKSNTASCGGRGGCNAPVNISSGSTYIDPPPSSNLVDFVPKSAFSPIDGGDGGSIYSASLSLGSITAEDLCVGPSFFEDVVLTFNRDDVEDDDVIAVDDDNDEDDGLDLMSTGGGVVAPPPSAEIACERKDVVETSLLNDDILAVQQQLLRQEQVLQYEREKLKHVQLPLQEKQQR
eukprot:scaffold33236_cov78-Skeletonema_dohrnii-CCMP3373.AAC.2